MHISALTAPKMSYPFPALKYFLTDDKTMMTSISELINVLGHCL